MTLDMNPPLAVRKTRLLQPRVRQHKAGGREEPADGRGPEAKDTARESDVDDVTSHIAPFINGTSITLSTVLE
jgi:hypothetical protein